MNATVGNLDKNDGKFVGACHLSFICAVNVFMANYTAYFGMKRIA